jgi:hypothetical protein
VSPAKAQAYLKGASAGNAAVKVIACSSMAGQCRCSHQLIQPGDGKADRRTGDEGMDWRKQELAGIGVLAASCAGAAWFLDMEFFALVFMFASAMAVIGGIWRLRH